MELSHRSTVMCPHANGSTWSVWDNPGLRQVVYHSIRNDTNALHSQAASSIVWNTSKNGLRSAEWVSRRKRIIGFINGMPL